MTENEPEKETLLYHIEALRGMLIKCLVMTFCIYPVVYYASGTLLELLIDWSFGDSGGELHYFGLMEVMVLRLKLSLVLSFVAAFPWNIYQLWYFLLPALYENERKALYRWILFSVFLFFAGVVFCAWGILPFLVRFSQSFASDNIKPILNIGEYIELVGWLSLAFGLMFQAPILVMLLVKFEIIDVGTLKKKRPYVIVIILILAGILTPPDVVSQIIMALPTILLFELGLVLARIVEKKKKEEGNNA